MKIRHYLDVNPEPLADPETSGVKRRVVISEADGAPNFIMRVFEVEPGGHTPYHRHPHEHEIFVQAGSGLVISKAMEFPVRVGDTVLILGEEMHQVKNTGDDLLEFICLVPRMKG